MSNFLQPVRTARPQNGSGPQQMAPGYKAKAAPRLRDAALVEVASLIPYGPL